MDNAILFIPEVSKHGPGGPEEFSSNPNQTHLNQIIQGLTRHTRIFQAGVLRQVGGKLCKTPALQDRVWTPLIHPNQALVGGVNVNSLCQQDRIFALRLNIQWVRKVFRPPYIFRSLLYCSHLLKSFKFIFFPQCTHSTPY